MKQGKDMNDTCLNYAYNFVKTTGTKDVEIYAVGNYKPVVNLEFLHFFVKYNNKYYDDEHRRGTSDIRKILKHYLNLKPIKKISFTELKKVFQDEYFSDRSR